MNSKNISIIEVAEKAGVSKSTVSRVLNNSSGVSGEARDKVMKALEELKFRPNISARALRSNVNRLIGILIPENIAHRGITHFINSEKISGAVKKVKELGYDVLIFIEDVFHEERLNHIIVEKGLQGVLLLDMVPPSVLDGFKSYGIPFVLVNWFSPGYEGQCYVKTDLSAATRMALELLESKGYTDIGVISWEDRKMQQSTIEDAFTRFMESRGYSAGNGVLNTSFFTSWEEVREFIESGRRRAYLCFSYHYSVKILELCREKGWRVPEDLALISYEFLDFYDYLQPRLTGIEQQGETMGALAAKKLVGMIRGKKEISSELVLPQLVIRDSC